MRAEKSLHRMMVALLIAGNFVFVFDSKVNMTEARHMAEQHAERVEHERTERMRDESRTQEWPREEQRRRDVDKAEQRRIEEEKRKTQEVTLQEESEMESREGANIKVSERRGGVSGKIISEAYFDKFVKRPPNFRFTVGENSTEAFSDYLMQSNESMESVYFSISKARFTSIARADTMLMFNMSCILNAKPIVSKKREPLFEVTVNEHTNIVKLKQISSYSESGFNVITGNVHLLDELYVPEADITLLLSNEKDEIIRIPVDKEVIEQWKKVTSADLKKMKREYEKR